MTTEVIKDIGEIFTRLFDHRPFTNGEIKFFFREFEEERRDREVENLFQTLQHTTELKDSNLARSQLASESHLPEIKLSLERTLTICDQVLENQNYPELEKNLELKREERKQIWKHFVDDMSHKCSRVDNTFEEKEEELREFYSDLERKLHIHK